MIFGSQGNKAHNINITINAQKCAPSLHRFLPTLYAGLSQITGCLQSEKSISSPDIVDGCWLASFHESKWYDRYSVATRSFLPWRWSTASNQKMQAGTRCVHHQDLAVMSDHSTSKGAQLVMVQTSCSRCHPSKYYDSNDTDIIEQSTQLSHIIGSALSVGAVSITNYNLDPRMYPPM